MSIGDSVDHLSAALPSDSNCDMCNKTFEGPFIVVNKWENPEELSRIPDFVTNFCDEKCRLRFKNVFLRRKIDYDKQQVLFKAVLDHHIRVKCRNTLLAYFITFLCEFLHPQYVLSMIL